MAAKKQVYSFDLTRRVENQVPDSIINELRRMGWNVWGIYELCKKELSAEKKAKNRKQNT